MKTQTKTKTCSVCLTSMWSYTNHSMAGVNCFTFPDVWSDHQSETSYMNSMNSWLKGCGWAVSNSSHHLSCHNHSFWTHLMNKCSLWFSCLCRLLIGWRAVRRLQPKLHYMSWLFVRMTQPQPPVTEMKHNRTGMWQGGIFLLHFHPYSHLILISEEMIKVLFF